MEKTYDRNNVVTREEVMRLIDMPKVRSYERKTPLLRVFFSKLGRQIGRQIGLYNGIEVDPASYVSDAEHEQWLFTEMSYVIESMVMRNA